MSDESEPVCAGLTCVRYGHEMQKRVDALTAQLAEAGDVIGSARAAYADDLRKRDELAGDRARRMDAELEAVTAARYDARSDRDAWKARALAAELEAMRAERDEARAPGVSFEREGDGRWIAGVDALPGVLAYGATREAALASVQALARKVIAERDAARADGHESGAEILVSCVHDLLWSAEHRGESVVDMAARCKRERDEAKARADAAEAEVALVEAERDDSADRERLAIAEWHRVRDERDALVPRVRDGWDEEHAVLRRELEHVRKDRDALRTRLTATFKALTGEP